MGAIFYVSVPYTASLVTQAIDGGKSSDLLPVNYYPGQLCYQRNHFDRLLLILNQLRDT
jgi:hypothetical protein